MTSAKKSLQRDSRLKRTLYSDIEIFGLEELQRAMRGMPKQVQKQVKNGNKAIANQVVKKMRSRSRGVFHAQQYDLIRPSIRAVQGRVPKIRMGNKTKAQVNPMYPSGKNRRKRENIPARGELVYGVEFGGRKIKKGAWTYAKTKSGKGRKYYGSTRQFPPWKKGGYVLFPTIKREHEFIKKTYTKNIEKALSKRF